MAQGTSKKRKKDDKDSSSKKSKISKAVSSAVAKLKTSEKKYFDTVLASGLLGSTGAHYKQLIFYPTTGPDETNRIGRTAKIHSVLVNATFGVPSNMYGVGWCHVMLILDTQPNASTFVSTDCWSLDLLESAMNLDNRKRFKVIRKWEFKLSGYTTGSNDFKDGEKQHRLNEFVKLSTEVEFNTVNGGSIADITKNALYLCGAFSINVPTLATAFPICNGVARCRFTDN